MARLRVYPRTRAADRSEIPHIRMGDWQEVPMADDRPSRTATERMWWRETGQLAYPAGAEVPDEHAGSLVGDEEHQAFLRGESPPDKPKPAAKPVAKRARGGR